MLVLFNSLILIEDDVCIKIKSLHTPSQIEAFKFRYWLSAKYVKNQVGKVRKVSIKRNLKNNQFINLNELVNLDDNKTF